MLCVVFVDFARLTRKLFHKSNKKIYWRFLRLYLQRREEQNEKKNSCKLQSVFSELNLLLRHVEAWLGSLISGMKNGHVITLF